MKPTKIILFLSLIILIGLFTPFILENNKIESVCFEKDCFSVELAKSQEEKMRGLMERKNLEVDKGMLFIYEIKGNYTFWTKNTLIPLDIIWIDSNFEVVDIKKAFPCLGEVCEIYSSNKKAKYVLEINANKSKEIGLNIGNKLVFK